MTKLYHFGLNLKTGMELIPDYHKKSKLVIPYIEALNKSEEAFEVMLLQGRYLREVMRRSGLREWSNYCKWAAEAVFEYVRQNNFPDRYSRIKTNYFYADARQCKELYKKDYLDTGDDNGEELFEVNVEDDYVQYFDMEIYNAAYEAMENQQPRRKRRGCCSHKVVAVGFNTLCYDAERRGIKPSARIKKILPKLYI